VSPEQDSLTSANQNDARVTQAQIFPAPRRGTAPGEL